MRSTMQSHGDAERVTWPKSSPVRETVHLETKKPGEQPKSSRECEIPKSSSRHGTCRSGHEIESRLLLLELMMGRTSGLWALA